MDRRASNAPAATSTFPTSSKAEAEKHRRNAAREAADELHGQVVVATEALVAAQGVAAEHARNVAEATARAEKAAGAAAAQTQTIIRKRLLQVEAKFRAAVKAALAEQKRVDAIVVDCERSLAEATEAASEAEGNADAAESRLEAMQEALAAREYAATAAKRAAQAEADRREAARDEMRRETEATRNPGKYGAKPADASDAEGLPGDAEETDGQMHERQAAASRRGQFYSSHVSATERGNKKKTYLAMASSVAPQTTSMPPRRSASASAGVVADTNVDSRIMAPTTSSKTKGSSAMAVEPVSPFPRSAPKHSAGNGKKGKKGKKKKKKPTAAGTVNPRLVPRTPT